MPSTRPPGPDTAAPDGPDSTGWRPLAPGVWRSDRHIDPHAARALMAERLAAAGLDGRRR